MRSAQTPVPICGSPYLPGFLVKLFSLVIYQNNDGKWYNLKFSQFLIYVNSIFTIERLTVEKKA